MEQPKNKATKKPRKSDQPLPVVPASAIHMAKVGGTIALIAAAAISAQTLISLGHTLGLHGRIAWLLPTSLDVYAATSIWVGYRIPSAHPAAGIARRDARLALALTVCCNALYHLLLLAGSQLPQWLTDGLLVLVGALPPLVVERIFHLQMSVRDGAGSADETPTADRADGRPGADSARRSAGERRQVPTPTRRPETPTAPARADGSADSPAPTAPADTFPAADGSADVIDLKTAGDAVRRPLPEWVELATPLYRQYLDEFGEGPNAPQLAALLDEAGHGAPGKSRSRDVRAATEKAINEDPEPVRAVNR